MTIKRTRADNKTSSSKKAESAGAQLAREVDARLADPTWDRTMAQRVIGAHRRQTQRVRRGIWAAAAAVLLVVAVGAFWLGGAANDSTVAAGSPADVFYAVEYNGNEDETDALLQMAALR